MENYISKAADAFLTSRPYGIRLDFKHKGFVIFNHHMNLLGNGTPCNLDSLPLEICNHTIFRHDNFIGCFSADKIKMSARKYFCFNIRVYKSMAEESSCRSPYHEEYIQTSASGNPEGLCH